MPAFQPTAAQFRAFRDDPREGPVVQVNLLKFRVRSDYPADHELHGTDEPGAAAYDRYVDAFADGARESGGECLVYGRAEHWFIGNGDWDAVLVMRFPSRRAFVAALNHPAYDAAHAHREAGLLCQELVSLEPTASDV